MVQTSTSDALRLESLHTNLDNLRKHLTLRLVLLLIAAAQIKQQSTATAVQRVDLIFNGFVPENERVWTTIHERHPTALLLLGETGVGKERLARAGVKVIEARLSHLAYAQEIASAMLKRQQAQAIVAARRQIVDGAVGMVQMALTELKEQGVIDLDEERKASMVSNLLVVLCGEENARPVVNTGSLYS